MSTTFVFPSRRMALFLSQLALILTALLFLTGCQSQKTIVHGLDEKEANDIIVFLDNKGIEAYKVQAKDSGAGGGTKIVLWDITVDSTKATEAMSLLNASGLPRRPGQNLLSIFAKGGLVPSEMEEKIKYQAGLGEQIASIIRKIDGVLDADVQLSFPEQDPLNPNAPKQKVTASVYVKHTGVLDDPNSHLITKIRRLVASSVQGLDYDNVNVIPDRARFSEVPYRPTANAHEEKDYVSIWTIVIAKESTTRFQVIFFSFLVIILMLLITLSWVIWKFYPLVNKLGGIKQLFSPHPMNFAMIQDALKGLSGPAKPEEKPSQNTENGENKPPENNDSGEAT